jgi:DNA-directed RNA polymerase subunit beta'
VPEDDEFVDDIDDDERLTPEEVERRDRRHHGRVTRSARSSASEALDEFMKIEPKQLIPDDALYREMRTNYSDYFTGGMGAEAIRDLLDSIDLRPRPTSCARSSRTARARSARRPSSA